MSVPHSGTRTLLEITGIDAVEAGLYGAGRWWHFGAHEDLLRKFRPHAHIPIRHPMDVARSWALRDKVGDVLENMIGRYEQMFCYLNDHDATFHRMEDLPRIAGKNEHKEVPSFSVKEFQAAVMERVVRPNRRFFSRFYDL